MPTPNAVQYTLQHLLQVAFPSVKTTIELLPTSVAAHVANSTLHFPLMGQDDCRALLHGSLPLSTIPAPTNHEVPIFRIVNKEGNYSVDNQEITIHYDIITLSFIMLSRAEEANEKAERDEHGRYLFKNSLAAKYHFVDLPIVDEYALLLRQWVCEALPTLAITPRVPKKISTHDIDIISRFGGFYKNVHTLAADLLKYRDWKMLTTSLAQFHACQRDELKDPYLLATDLLLQQDLAAEWESVFFLKSLRPSDPDFTYDIFGTQAAHLIRTVEARGGSIGLHGSYPSFNQKGSLTKEKIYLETVANHAITRGRQHYLRYDCRRTPAVWQAAGITEDYTLGYAEQEGFRCGTCHPFYLYDLTHDCATSIIEHPLIAMDGTFFQYQQIDCAETVARLQQLMQRCAAVEGDFVLLWHNSCVWREYQSWFHEVFLQVVNTDNELNEPRTN